MPEEFVGAPIFREFHRCPAEIAMILVELALKPAEKREGVGGRARKSGEDLFLIETAYLLGAVLDNGLAKRDLTVSGHDNFAVATHAQDGGGTNARRASVFTCLY